MENQKTRERRNLASPVKLTEAESRTVEGYALLFNTPSDGLPIEEIIESGALEGVVARSNVFALLDHDKQRGILARSKNGVGTLELVVDEKGLLYRFEAPHTALGDEVLEYLRRGDISESSFCFTVESDTWEKRSDGSWKRTIHKFEELFDVSPVYDAAYSATSVCLRGKEQAEKELAERNRQAERMDESYYNQFFTNF